MRKLCRAPPDHITIPQDANSSTFFAFIRYHPRLVAIDSFNYLNSLCKVEADWRVYLDSPYNDYTAFFIKLKNADKTEGGCEHITDAVHSAVASYGGEVSKLLISNTGVLTLQFALRKA